MNFTTWLWAEGSGFHTVLRFPFTVLSWIYGVVIRLRLLFYAIGLLSKKRVDCRVISIGNMTVGGTGKTPMTLYLAEQWRKRGAKVGIVSRGYGRKKKEAVIVVCDGRKVLESAESVGDEPVLMAKRLLDISGGIPIIVASDRYEGCQKLLKDFKVDLILLDDAFQHIRMHRDQNLLLIDAANPFGNTHLLPRGLLREPISEIRRADTIVITRSNIAKNLSDLNDQLETFGRPILKSRFAATEVLALSTGASVSLDELKNRPILAFCGIGNPSSFFKQLLDLGAELKETKVFQDHHVYETSDILDLNRCAKEIGVHWLVTTEKDAVKITALAGGDFMETRCFALRIGLEFLESAEWKSPRAEKVLFSS